MMYGNDWGWGWMMLMPLVWITVLGLIIWAAVRLAQPSGRQQAPADHGQPGRESAQEILDRRFASGEIDADTYTQTRQRLAG